MAENLQKNTEQQGPFSPLQTGCAFVMLSNMLIYLAVVAFTFNLLDPSKLDASYLAKRGFTAKPETEREEDRAFRRISEEKRKTRMETQNEMVDADALNRKQKPSAAVELSEIHPRAMSSSRPSEPERPRAALTQSPLRTGGSSVRTARSRLYSILIFSQASVSRAYIPYLTADPRTIAPEQYDPIPVELAPGPDFPDFRLPSVGSRRGIYSPPSPLPPSSRGGIRFSSPPIGAEPLYTNGVRKTNAPPYGENL